MTVSDLNIFKVERDLNFKVEQSSFFFADRGSTAFAVERQKNYERSFFSNFLIQQNTSEVKWFSKRHAEREFYQSAFGSSVCKLDLDLESWFHLMANEASNSCYVFSSLFQSAREETQIDILDSVVDRHQYVFVDQDYRRVLQNQLDFAERETKKYLHRRPPLVEKRRAQLSHPRTVYDQTKIFSSEVQKLKKDSLDELKKFKFFKKHLNRAMVAIHLSVCSSGEGIQFGRCALAGAKTLESQPTLLLAKLFDLLADEGFKKDNTEFYFFSDHFQYASFFRMLMAKFFGSYHLYDPALFYGQMSVVNVAKYMADFENNTQKKAVLIDVDSFPNFQLTLLSQNEKY